MRLGSADGTIPIRSELADDPDFRELLELFAETIAEKLQSFRDSYRDGNIDQVRVQAHQLKGAGGGYGFPVLSKAAAELEQACKANETDRIAVCLDVVLDSLGRIEI